MDLPATVQTLCDRAIALHSQQQYDEAIHCLTAAQACLPHHPHLHANLGVVYRDSGDLVRGEQHLRHACELRPSDPAIHFNLALTLLRAGRLREGFDEYEWRWQLPQFAAQLRNFAQPLWDGQPLDGRRILLHTEQGAGDAIQFVRYAPLVRAAGGRVILETLPHLERLFHWMEGDYPVVNALTGGVSFDIQCPLLDLPRRFSTGLDSIPAAARFTIPAALQTRWRRRIQTGERSVGIVWAGNPAHANDLARSIPVESLHPLTSVPATHFWSLQVALADTPPHITNLSSELTDFADTAAAISVMDLVVTVDTAVAHLAGSLGRPVWLLLPYTSDWRWMLTGDRSPWYPSMRLFRQQHPNDWPAVIERVVAAALSQPI